MLAVLHHLVVTERIPLGAILDLARDLGRRALVIEFVAVDDPMFVRILRGRDALFRDWTRERFEHECRARFRTVRALELSATRWLYHLEPEP